MGSSEVNEVSNSSEAWAELATKFSNRAHRYKTSRKATSASVPFRNYRRDRPSDCYTELYSLSLPKPDDGLQEQPQEHRHGP